MEPYITDERGGHISKLKLLKPVEILTKKFGPTCRGAWPKGRERQNPLDRINKGQQHKFKQIKYTYHKPLITYVNKDASSLLRYCTCGSHHHLPIRGGIVSMFPG